MWWPWLPTIDPIFGHHKCGTIITVAFIWIRRTPDARSQTVFPFPISFRLIQFNANRLLMFRAWWRLCFRFDCFYFDISREMRHTHSRSGQSLIQCQCESRAENGDELSKRWAKIIYWPSWLVVRLSAVWHFMPCLSSFSSIFFLSLAFRFRIRFVPVHMCKFL